MALKNLDANVQYGDLEGTAAADENTPQGDLHTMAADAGVDITKYHVVAAEWYLSEGRYAVPGDPAPWHVTFYLIAKADMSEGETYLNYIQKAASPKLYAKTVELSADDAFEGLKRVSVVLRRGGIGNLREFDVVDVG